MLAQQGQEKPGAQRTEGQARRQKTQRQAAAGRPGAGPYRQAFYEKLTAPLTVIAMTLLAMPLVLSRPRSGTPGQYVFTGALVGVVFYLLNSAAAHAGAVYGLPPALSAPAPTLLLLSGLGGWLLLPRLRELIRP